MKVSLALLVMVCPLLLNAQQTTPAIDSLEKLIPTQTGAQLSATYTNLTWEYRTIDREKAILYGNKAIQEARSINSPASEAQAYNDLGIIYFDKEQYDTAVDLYTKAMNIRRQLKDELGIAKLHNKIGIVYQNQGLLEQGLGHQLKALELFEKHKDDKGTAYSLNNIGTINQSLGRYAEAIKYHEQSIAIKQKMGDSYGLAGSFVNVGSIYQLSKNYTKAEAYYLDAIRLTRGSGDKESLATALNNLGQLFSIKGDYEKAKPLIRESLSLQTQLSDTKGRVSCLISMGDIYTGQRHFDSAGIVLNQALKMARSAVNCQAEETQAMLSLSLLYEKTGNNQAALDMYKLYSGARDSLFTERLGQKVAEMETRFKTVEHEKTIQQQQFELQQKNYWLAAVISILMLSKLLIYWYYRRYKHSQKIRLQEEISRQQAISAKAVIIAAEEERQRIARDLHDGVGQMMSAAKMNLSAFESNLPGTSKEHQSSLEKIMTLVDESCREIRQVSHNMMLSTSFKKTLGEALKDFINKIDHNTLNIHLYTEGLDQSLDPSTEVMLYRIIQECVNNVIKHAHATILDISIIRDTDGISATIEDNGRGFDAREKVKSGGMGLKNIHTRIEYLKGNIDIDSSPGRGTVISLQIPAVA
ncbi:sensor histidine kinase [Terrimonas sp. NA20]|uniref:Oxygen sensor histidine kinase NreB n=1 Tax=Terrimonas ginsenosidimutans TaxID=2908004 RepID=A0ABS9KTL6_9BACT|nr:tetratricopeptide repeat protein [Terrimonas ginsenosidimutans]MCG2615668.1 sensor histidine kinase [Terrimonas ginsenosidimutans]